MNFLQQHYNAARDRGVSHALYVVANDIDDNKPLCESLKRGYEQRVKPKRPTEEATRE